MRLRHLERRSATRRCFCERDELLKQNSTGSEGCRRLATVCPREERQEAEQAAAITARFVSLLLLALSTNAAPKFRWPDCCTATQPASNRNECRPTVSSRQPPSAEIPSKRLIDLRERDARSRPKEIQRMATCQWHSRQRRATTPPHSRTDHPQSCGTRNRLPS